MTVDTPTSGAPQWSATTTLDNPACWSINKPWQPGANPTVMVQSTNAKKTRTEGLAPNAVEVSRAPGAVHVTWTDGTGAKAWLMMDVMEASRMSAALRAAARGNL